MSANIIARSYKGSFHATMATLTAKGAASAKVSEAIGDNIAVVVSRYLAHGENGEAFAPAKGAPVAWIANLTDKANKGKLAQAFRGTVDFVREHIKAHGKPLTQDAHDGLCDEAASLFWLATASKPRTSKSEAERSADALERAVKAIVDSASVLSAAQADAIRQALALADGIRDAQAAKATQAAPAETVTA